MISAELISDERFNSISIEAQNIFIRMLSVSDDCGVVPANTYRLNTIINTPTKSRDKIQKVIDDIVIAGLGYRFDFNGEKFFAFKKKSFEEYQSYILKKATKSEYLRIPKEEYEELSKNFQEFTRTSLQLNESAVSTVESNKQIVDSREYKVKSRKQKEFVPPSKTEVIVFFEENGFPALIGGKAFEYYHEADWHDSGGKQVRNWKQKMISVWFKEENRNGTHKQGAGKNYGERQSITADDLRRTADEVKRRVNRRDNIDSRTD